jgi:AbrB family looped-hinge helix DNA binding protein
MMRVTMKGQVTIPLETQEKLGITPATEVDFIMGEDGRVYIQKRKDQETDKRFSRLRG